MTSTTEKEIKPDVVTTTFRIPEKFYEEIKSVAERDGNTINGIMLVLARLGLKIYDDKIIVKSFIEEK